MLVKLINHCLKKYFDRDPEVAGRLQALEGKNLVFHLTDLKKEFLVAPGQEGVVVVDHIENESIEITARVQADVVTLLNIALGAKYQPLLENGSVYVQGDFEAVRQMGRIFRDVEIDWEEIAAPCVGDVLAHQLGTCLGHASSYKRRSIKNFLLDVSEYLQEESRVMPARAEIERFLKDATSLETDIGHLEARIDRLGKTDRR